MSNTDKLSNAYQTSTSPAPNDKPTTNAMLYCSNRIQFNKNYLLSIVGALRLALIVSSTPIIFYLFKRTLKNFNFRFFNLLVWFRLQLLYLHQ